LGLFDAIHHRGQLTVYIRPMGGKVPAIYGPSADDEVDIHQPFLGEEKLSNIEEGEPDASLFQIPPGYTKMDMGSMMQMGHPPQQ
ncbi:MAG TPA: DinB family protein, partial [Candidatus Limnocylindrales bacterium]|nr:DinB family protein [Candidatus Limnocylindrales bacterium]